MPTIYETFMVSGTHGVHHEGVDGGVRHDVQPNIELNSSKLDAIHATVYPRANGNVAESCLGEAIAAKNGSKVLLRGSKEFANKIIGANSGNAQHRRAGLYATDNSTISIQGPTVVAQFGVDVLVDNNSQLEICPHRNDEGMTLASSFSLNDPANHTMVELHSTRSCIVADNGSVVNLQDLGSYHDLWPVGTYGAALDLTKQDYLKSGQAGTTEYVSAVSAGSLQFYPNAFLNQVDIPYKPNKTNLTAAHRNFDTGSYDPQPYYYIYDVPETQSGKLHASTGLSSVTTGGMCLRALNQSKVNVQNVHFPTGHVQTSSVIYDFSGIDGKEANCTRTFIWNIADDSILKASYVSVSGQHPQDAGYVGPSGNWGGHGQMPASAAPDSTADTSGLSVLDYYGPDDSNQNLFGASSIKNFGAFRLYFSVDPMANYLVDPSAVLSGYATQVFAQGYQFSGALSAPANVSAEYTKALFSTDSITVSNAGFFYASSMVHSPKTVKAVLDDSAMNTFANAKHNTVNKSGLANVVTRYDSFDTGFGGDSTSNKDSGRGVASVNNFNLRKLD